MGLCCTSLSRPHGVSCALLLRGAGRWSVYVGHPAAEATLQHPPADVGEGVKDEGRV